VRPGPAALSTSGDGGVNLPSHLPPVLTLGDLPEHPRRIEDYHRLQGTAAGQATPTNPAAVARPPWGKRFPSMGRDVKACSDESPFAVLASGVHTR
jgi:hypothetical protein